MLSLNDLYSSPSIVRVMKSRRMRWAGHVPRVGREERRVQGIGRGNLMERDHSEDPGIDGRTILRWIFGKWGVGVRTGSSRLRIGAGSSRLRIGAGGRYL
jgi:hypothetical protein